MKRAPSSSRARSRKRPQPANRRLLLISAALVVLLLGLFLSNRLPGVSARGPIPAESEIPEVDLALAEPRVKQFIETASQRVRSDRRSAEAWGNLGIAYDAHELYDPAIACYRLAKRLDPKDERWSYFLARVLEFKSEDAEEIASAYRDATKCKPNYAPIRVRLGDALQRQNSFEEARASYQRATELDPNLWLGHRGLGQALLSLDRPQEAVAPLERAVQLNPEDGAARASLARALNLNGERERAVAESERSRVLEQLHTLPDTLAAKIGAAGISGGICFERANDLMDLGRFAEAIENLRISEEVMTDNPHVQVRWGRCAMQLKDRAEAIRRFQRAVQLKDDLDDVHLQLGQLLAAEGKFNEALPSYRLALRSMDTGATRALLAAALAQSGDRSGALREFARADSQGGMAAQDYNNWGSTLAQAGTLREAAVRFQRAADLDPRSASARFNWGRVLEDMGDSERALSLFRESAQLDPRGPAAQKLAALAQSSAK